MNKKIIYFHVRNGTDAVRKNSYVFDHPKMLQHTYAISKTGDNEVTVGYSIVHDKDHFCRKIGRELSTRKLQKLENIPEVAFNNRNGRFLPESLCYSIEDALDKAREIFKMSYPLIYKTIINDGSKKIPVKDEIEKYE